MSALTQAHIDALEKALASGILSVDSPDVGRITYRSGKELLDAIAYAKAAIAGSGGSTQSYASFCRD